MIYSRGNVCQTVFHDMRGPDHGSRWHTHTQTLHTEWSQTFRLPPPPFSACNILVRGGSVMCVCNVTPPRSEPLSVILGMAGGHRIYTQSHTLKITAIRVTHSLTHTHTMACTRPWGLTLATFGSGILQCFGPWMMPHVSLSTVERRLWMQLWLGSWRGQEEEVQKPVSPFPVSLRVVLVNTSSVKLQALCWSLALL